MGLDSDVGGRCPGCEGMLPEGQRWCSECESAGYEGPVTGATPSVDAIVTAAISADSGPITDENDATMAWICEHAELIASAPSLLAACERLLDRVRDLRWRIDAETGASSQLRDGLGMIGEDERCALAAMREARG